ncbi:microspherule protein 1-like isoform X2 [Acanthaster planci]|uniref:Microspherule protein 1 n=1 Tax=Acanthaster planci TaxID=133434 RepID=A0A8B7XGR4_ACAPL|nr:microspherule protein 1-like isoform X2 [Acanthaster planci]
MSMSTPKATVQGTGQAPASQTASRPTVTRTVVTATGTASIPKMTPQYGISPLISDSLTKRRSSSRSIKRKKFDDELVESSLLKTSKGKVSSTTSPSGQPPPVEKEEKKEKEKEIVKPPVHHPPVTERRKVASRPSTSQTHRPPSSHRPSSSSRRSKKPKSLLSLTKDHGRWKPQDDLLLISAVQQTNDLETVYQGVKFSCRFTLKEVEERWYALLYDPAISKLSQQAMRALHPEVKAFVLSKAIYSEDEENLLGTVTSTSQPTVETFQELITKSPTSFHPARTAKALYTHWLLMKQYHLLPDQSVQPMPRGDHVLNFSDAEDMLDDTQLQDQRDDILEHELSVFDRRQKREIRNLENEIVKWQYLVDSVTGMTSPAFDNQTLAVLRGRLVRYLMRSNEITIGRSTSDSTVDVDLSLEGPAWKVSRRQGLIKLRNNGEFYVANEGKRAIHVDGKAIIKGMKSKLNNNSVVEIAGLRFIFLINQELINAFKNESIKGSA